MNYILNEMQNLLFGVAGKRSITLQAAVLLAKLPYLGDWPKSRRRAATHYDQLLSNLPVQTPVAGAGASLPARWARARGLGYTPR